MKKTSKLLISSIVAIFALVLIAVSSQTKNNSKFFVEEKYYNSGEVIKLDSEEIKALSNESFLLFTYNSYCGMAKPCEEVFDAVLKKNKIDYVSIPIDEFRKTKYYDTVKLAPSFIIIKNGVIVAYLDAENDNHLKYYQEETDFEKWLGSHIYLSM